jgi:steroid delta-isomerase
MTFPAMPQSVDQFFRASQSGDAQAWAAAFAEDALFHDPVGEPPLTGRPTIQAFIESVIPAFDPFLGLTPIDAHTTNHHVAVTWRGAAVTKDGRPINWSGINTYELNGDGLIQEAKAYFNRAIFQAQLD